MEIKITKSSGSLSLLSKITYILMGVMLISLLYSFAIKILGTWGLYLCLLVSIPGIYFGFKKTKPGTKRRMLLIGLTVMTVTMIVTYVVFLVNIASVKL